MKLTGIHHCSIVVSDMDRAVAFYKRILGLPEIGIPSTFPPAGLRVRWFQLGDQQLHLIPTPEPDATSPRHVALNVDDAQAARAELKNKGVAISESVPIPGANRFFVSDPDGNKIELIEWKKTYHVVRLE